MDKVHPVTGEVVFSAEDHERKMRQRHMTPDGREIPDPRPAKPHVRTQRVKSMFDFMREAVRREIEHREDMREETPEEMADMGDDIDEDMVESLSEYERIDLELELARRAKLAEGERGSPEPEPASSGQGAKPAEGGAGAAGALDASAGQATQ